MISPAQWSNCKVCSTEASEEEQGELDICIRESRSCIGAEKSFIQWEENLKVHFSF